MPGVLGEGLRKKRAHGQEQQCGDCWWGRVEVEEGTGRINGDEGEKNVIYKKV